MQNSLNSKKKAFSFIELAIVIIIIGIFVAAITQGSSLIYNAILSRSQVETSKSPLNNLKNLELWLETTLNESINQKDRYDELPLAESAWQSIHKTNLKKNISLQNGDSQKNKATYHNREGVGRLPSVYIPSTTNIEITNTHFLNKHNEFTLIVVDFSYNKNTKIDSFFSCKDKNVEEVFKLEMPAPNDTNDRVTYYKVSVVKAGSEGINNYTVTTYINNKKTKDDKTYIVSEDIIINKCFIGGGYDGNLSEIILISDNVEGNELKLIYNYLSKKYDIKINYD
jgi:prepilin-type N-terminal cleavage/methylation domain-containing protein